MTLWQVQYTCTPLLVLALLQVSLRVLRFCHVDIRSMLHTISYQQFTASSNTHGYSEHRNLRSYFSCAHQCCHYILPVSSISAWCLPSTKCQPYKWPMRSVTLDSLLPGLSYCRVEITRILYLSFRNVFQSRAESSLHVSDCFSPSYVNGRYFTAVRALQAVSSGSSCFSFMRICYPISWT